MILGFTPPTFLHVFISLAGIVTGFVVIYGLTTAKRLPGVTAVFLVTTVLTSAQSFFLPAAGLTPARILGIISLVVLAPAIYALYGARLAGPWRAIYAGNAVLAQYLNCFVLVVQLFRRVSALAELAPTQSEPPFAIAQGVVFLVFLWLGVRAVKGFRSA